MANALCHFELMATDVERAKKFYSSVLDWQFEMFDLNGSSAIDAEARSMWAPA